MRSFRKRISHQGQEKTGPNVEIMNNMIKINVNKNKHKIKVFDYAASFTMILPMLLGYCSAWSAKHFELPDKQLLPGQKVVFLHSFSV